MDSIKSAITVGLIGFGNVGQGVSSIIDTNRKMISKRVGQDVIIKTICVRNVEKYKDLVKDISLTDNVDEILDDPNIDIVVEVIGGEQPAYDYITKALLNKKYVVTANKELIAKHKQHFFKLAKENEVDIFFEASVGGGIPIIRTIKEGLATNKINKVFGILNGTCNYILSEMEDTKENFETVLKKAQTLGYAEPGNPKLDLNGYDALAKVRILSSLAFNKKISPKKCLMEGIENIEIKDIEIADQLNLKIKLLGITELINNQVFERVHPCLINKDNYIANVNGVMNAIILNGKPVGESVLQGEGAGPGATSSALMSDILSILRGNIKFPFGIPDSKRKSVNIYNIKNYSNSLYLRFEVKDKPGVLSSLTSQLAKKNISVERLIQIPDHKMKTASIVIVTHKSREIDAQNCLRSFSKNKNILKIPTLIRLF